jgi:hypothetical protein
VAEEYAWSAHQFGSCRLLSALCLRPCSARDGARHSPTTSDYGDGSRCAFTDQPPVAISRLPRGPIDHRYRVLTHPGEQRILKISRRRCPPAARPTGNMQCWRPRLLSLSSGFRRHKEWRRRLSRARTAAPPGCSAATALPPQALYLLIHPARSRVIHLYVETLQKQPVHPGFIQDSGTSERAAPFANGPNDLGRWDQSRYRVVNSLSNDSSNGKKA